MFSNFSTSINERPIHHPILDSGLPFSDYIARCRALIEEHRTDLKTNQAEAIIQANCPFELNPRNPIRQNGRLKYGALLIHGLLDSPFSLRDIGSRLQANGILSRAILLPGHGTSPQDLLTVSYHDWIQAVRYGVETLRHEVDEIYLIGYSTGAALSVYHALQDSQISGVVLLSPAIQIRIPMDVMTSWYYISRWLNKKNHGWLFSETENDYVKYHSIGFNAVSQVAKLTGVLKELEEFHPLLIPMYMVISHEDETISSHRAINFFDNTHNPDSRLLLYTSTEHQTNDTRILTRRSTYPELAIQNFSHICIPFAPGNSHYGQAGDYSHASHPGQENVLFGAYNPLQEKFYDGIYGLGLLKEKRHALTYNPDFEFMANNIVKFILGTN